MEHSRKEATSPEVDAFILECHARFRDTMPDFTLCTSKSTAKLLYEIDPAMSVTVIDRERWQSVLLDLGPRMSPGSREALSTAQHRAMEWARTDGGPFMWIHDASAPSAGLERRRNSRPPIPLATTELVADSILSTLQHDIIAGRLGGGDRITETYLARSAHASRGHVRDALRVLASRGIIDLQPNRGAVVPRPGVDDVIETYGARRALGALIVRRVAEPPVPDHLQHLEKALSNMLETAQTGDAWATGEDDLRFQEVMAEITGMKRVPTMFSSLTAQLRMFVAVLGLRYAYSIPNMCQDDIALLRLITDRNGPEAVSRWNSKMKDAANYMIQQLDPKAHVR
jgi:DNA-binding GntR family transcriptional regulator